MAPRLRAALAALVLLALACEAAPALPGRVATRADLENRDLVSTVVQFRDEAVPLVPGNQFREPALVVRFNETRIGASGGCNWSGAEGWDVVDGRLVVPDGFDTTLMGCPAAVESQDRWLVDLLRSQPVLRVDEERYFFVDGETVAIFVEGDLESL